MGFGEGLVGGDQCPLSIEEHQKKPFKPGKLMVSVEPAMRLRTNGSARRDPAPCPRLLMQRRQRNCRPPPRRSSPVSRTRSSGWLNASAGFNIATTMITMVVIAAVMISSRRSISIETIVAAANEGHEGGQIRG
jgi:hypothetical protein